LVLYAFYDLWPWKEAGSIYSYNPEAHMEQDAAETARSVARELNLFVAHSASLHSTKPSWHTT